VRITADTNLLVRMATRDDEAQAAIAFEMLSTVEEVIVPLPCVLELVWVLESVYAFKPGQVTVALKTLLRMQNLTADRLVIDAGIRILAAGGDFADGVIAAAGVSMGADMFVSFDLKAVSRVNAIGIAAKVASVPS
jgi:predicted nucleic-acid-binding protein